MNGHLQIPRLSVAEGRLIRVSDFYRPGESAPYAAYFAAGQTTYQPTNFLYDDALNLIDLNVWTPDGTDIDVEDHGTFVPRVGAWSYVTPNDWVPVSFTLRLPQYIILNWAIQAFESVPGDRPDLDAMLDSVNSTFLAVLAFMQSNRLGKTFVQINLDFGIGYSEQQFFSPGIGATEDLTGILEIDANSVSVLRGNSIAEIRDDVSAEFLGVNTLSLWVGVTTGMWGFPLGSVQGIGYTDTSHRFASFDVLSYGDPKDLAFSEAFYDTLAVDVDLSIEKEYRGDPSAITTDGLMADLATFFRFDPLTGVDDPL